MDAIGLLFLAVPMMAALVPGIGMIVGGVALARRSADGRGLVAVEAIVVDRTRFTDPARLTFDYPLPNGTWARATRVEGVPSPGQQGAARRPGERITVWVNPRNPSDVRLPGARAAAGLGGILLAVIGGLLCLGALTMAAFMITLAG